MTDAPLTRRERLRRTAILCGHFIRNLAYHRVGRKDSTERVDRGSRLHVAINGNFLDMAVLEWLKLFVSTEQHSWQKVVRDKAQFRADLLKEFGLSEEVF